MTMDISVIICTFNRAELLADTLASYFGMERPAEVEAELIVVDNNSSDSTRAVIEECQRRDGAVRYVFEPTAGLSYARNAGIAEARGRIVAFADDDVYFDGAWLAAVVRTFDESPDAMALGGLSIPVFDGGRPAWVTDDLLGWYGSTGSGSEIKTMAYPEHPFGLNMAFRRSALEAVGRFSTALGRQGESLLSNEESDLFLRLHRQRLRVVYTPHAVVHHRVAKSRASKEWILRRSYWQGVSDVVADVALQGRARWRVILDCRWELRQVVHLMWRGLVTPGKANRTSRSVRFDERVYIAHLLGRISQRLRRASTRS